MKGDKNLFFLIISFICFWLVLDQYYGKKLIGSFVGGITGGFGGNNFLTTEQQQTLQQENLNKLNSAPDTSKFSDKVKKYLSGLGMLDGTVKKSEVITQMDTIGADLTWSFSDRKDLMKYYKKLLDQMGDKEEIVLAKNDATNQA